MLCYPAEEIHFQHFNPLGKAATEAFRNAVEQEEALTEKLFFFEGRGKRTGLVHLQEYCCGVILSAAKNLTESYLE